MLEAGACVKQAAAILCDPHCNDMYSIYINVYIVSSSI